MSEQVEQWNISINSGSRLMGIIHIHLMVYFLECGCTFDETV